MGEIGRARRQFRGTVEDFDVLELSHIDPGESVNGSTSASKMSLRR